MYKIPAKTLFAGKNLVYVPQCHSTNTLAAELAQKVGTPEGTVVITSDQTAGRGQRGNVWQSDPGKNLTFSLILRPGFLAAKDQFQLNQAVALGIADYLTGQTIQKVAIKWPNDILLNALKTCGILIENHLTGECIGSSIVGIGLNINQLNFQHTNATSLSLATGKDFQLDHEFETLLHDIEIRYLELRQGKKTALETDYLSFLYRKDETHEFSSQGNIFEGIIIGVSNEGKLKVMVDGELKLFGIKEIAFA